MTRYKPSEDYTQWVKWPQHITAPIIEDMDFIENAIQVYKDKGTFFVGKVMSPGGDIRIVFHPTFVWYYDGANSLTFVSILFPDGTEWTPYL